MYHVCCRLVVEVFSSKLNKTLNHYHLFYLTCDLAQLTRSCFPRIRKSHYTQKSYIRK